MCSVLPPNGNHQQPFLLRGLQGERVVLAPLSAEEVERVAGRPDQCPLAKVCHGEAFPLPSLQEHVGIKVPAGTILVVNRGVYG